MNIWLIKLPITLLCFLLVTAPCLANEPAENTALLSQPLSIINLPIVVKLSPQFQPVENYFINHINQQSIDIRLNQQPISPLQPEPLYRAGMRYQWQLASFTTGIIFNNPNYLQEDKETHYWRVGGELEATDWLDFKVNYHQDINAEKDSIYSVGTGLRLGKKLKLELTGVISGDNNLSGALQSSYHF